MSTKEENESDSGRSNTFDRSKELDDGDDINHEEDNNDGKNSDNDGMDDRKKKHGHEESLNGNDEDASNVKVTFKGKIIPIPIDGILNRTRSVDNNRHSPTICEHFILNKCNYLDDICFKIHLKESTNYKIIEKIRNYVLKNNRNGDDPPPTSSSRNDKMQFVLTKKEGYRNNHKGTTYYKNESFSSPFFSKRKRNNNGDSDDDDNDNDRKRKCRYGFMRNGIERRGINNNIDSSNFREGIRRKEIKVDIDGSGNGCFVEIPLEAMESTKQSIFLCKSPEGSIGKLCSYFGVEDATCKKGINCSFLHVTPWFLRFVRKYSEK